HCQRIRDLHDGCSRLKGSTCPYTSRIVRPSQPCPEPSLTPGRRTSPGTQPVAVGIDAGGRSFVPGFRPNAIPLNCHGIDACALVGTLSPSTARVSERSRAARLGSYL